MSVLDTLSMLEKRAAGDEPEPKYSERELRLFALEMQKQAMNPILLPFELPFEVGKGTVNFLKGTGGPSVAGKALKSIANLGALGISRGAEFVLDHTGKAFRYGLPIGFFLHDMAGRAKNLKHMPNIPDVAGPRKR